MASSEGQAFATALSAALGARVMELRKGQDVSVNDEDRALVCPVPWIKGIAPRTPGLCCCAIEHMDRLKDENIDAVYEKHTL